MEHAPNERVDCGVHYIGRRGLRDLSARELGVAIRGGCFCNPGAAEHAFGIRAQVARDCLRDEFSVARFRQCLGDGAVGAIRASVGVATNDDDLDRLLECIERVLDAPQPL